MQAQYITRKEWNTQWKVRFKRLRGTHPEKSPEWAREKAYAQTLQAWGRRPPSFLSVVITFVKEIAKAGGIENMDFKWGKAVYKGVRAAVGTALSAAVVVFVGNLFNAFDTAAELQQLGLPGIFIPITLGVLASLRNYLKVKQGWRL